MAYFEVVKCMSDASLSVGNVFRVGLSEFKKLNFKIPWDSWRVVHNIHDCRTARLGGHLYQCDECGTEVPMYNSCSDRHCPNCQSKAQNKWIEQRVKEILPETYFHIVLTMPSELYPIALRNKKIFYNMMFSAIHECFQKLEKDPQWFGGKVGYIAVLHTWTQQLLLHPHMHVIFPGGCLLRDGRWKSCRGDYLVPNNIISKLYRGIFLEKFFSAVKRKEIQFYQELKKYDDKRAQYALKDKLYTTHWNTYIKEEYNNSTHVMEYIGRYTHRIAISNIRIKKVEDGNVTFSYKDRERKQTLTATIRCSEFIKRFTYHILPKGFVRIRYYGVLAGTKQERRKVQRLCCESLGISAFTFAETVLKFCIEKYGKDDEEKEYRCPICKNGVLRFKSIIRGGIPGYSKKIA